MGGCLVRRAAGGGNSQRRLRTRLRTEDGGRRTDGRRDTRSSQLPTIRTQVHQATASQAAAHTGTRDASKNLLECQSAAALTQRFQSRPCWTGLEIWASATRPPTGQLGDARASSGFLSSRASDELGCTCQAGHVSTARDKTRRAVRPKPSVWSRILRHATAIRRSVPFGPCHVKQDRLR
jgi:hypothetical protein